MVKPGEVYIVCLPEGGAVTLSQLSDNLKYRWFDPEKGEFISEGEITADSQKFNSAESSPVVLIVN